MVQIGMDGRTWHEANDFLWKQYTRLRVQVGSLQAQLAERRDAWERLTVLQERHEKLKNENQALRRRMTLGDELLGEFQRPTYQSIQRLRQMCA